MKKVIFLFVGLLVIFSASINAQELLRVDEIEIVNSQVNNVTIQIKTAELGQTILSKVNQTNVNEKEGFNAQFNSDNTLLSLNFSRNFSKDELKTLLVYTGVDLKSEDFNQLYNLIN